MPRSSRGPLPALRSKPRVSTQTLQIDTLTPEGRGLARVNGQPVFIAGCLPGERVKARVQGRGKQMKGELIELLEASPSRVEPSCPLYSRCGGCDLQHIDSAQQLGFKQQWVQELLKRLGNLEPQEWADPITSASFGYRQRARLALRWQGNQLFLGFRQKSSSRIEPVSACPVLQPELSALIPPLFQVIRSLGAKSGISHLELTRLDAQCAVLLRTLKPLKEKAQQRLSDFAQQHALSLWLQPEEDKGSRIQLSPVEGGELHYRLEDQSEISAKPGDFIQVNPEVNRKMVSQALAWLAPKAGERVLDLFCGIGNFSLPLARQAAEVVAIEGVAQSLQQGAENAKRNGLDNIRWQQADLDRPLEQQRWAQGGFDRILLDPPRTGARAICEQIGALGAKQVLYVSCNPATLARDGALLQQQGYCCRQVGVMEMFPQTSHVETMALFVRKA